MTIDDALLTNILKAYEDAELKLTAKIQQLILNGLDDEIAVKTLQAQKLAQVKELKDYTVKQLLQLKGLDDDARQLVIRDFLAGASSVAGGNGIVGTNSAALGNLLTEYTQGITDSRYQILRSTVDAYRQIVAQVTTQSALGIDTRIQTARQALDRFADKGIDSFVTADGKRLEMRDYVRMATRSTLANAQRVGRLQQLVKDDRDLIIVRTGPRYCPLCEPYKDAILSISGKTSGYPSLDEAKGNGLYHSNCRCSLSAYIPGLIDVESKDTIDNNYEAEEQQRYFERQTRRWSRRAVVADTPEAKAKAKDKVQLYKDKISALVEDENLTRKRQNESNVAAR